MQYGLDLVKSECFSLPGKDVLLASSLTSEKCQVKEGVIKQASGEVLSAPSGSTKSFATSAFSRLLPLLTAGSLIHLAKLVFVHACMYWFLGFTCFPTVLWRQEYGDQTNLSPFFQTCGACETLFYGAVACVLQ